MKTEKTEFLFRGKSVNTGEWVEGSYLDNKHGVKKPQICPSITFFDFAPSFEDGMDFEKESEKGAAFGLFFEVIPETVGQFWQTDNYGHDIFDGDIRKTDSGDTFRIYNFNGVFSIKQSVWLTNKKDLIMGDELILSALIGQDASWVINCTRHIGNIFDK